VQAGLCDGRRPPQRHVVGQLPSRQAKTLGYRRGRVRPARPVINPHVARPMIRLRRSALGVPAQRECVDTVNTAGVFDHR
jgi:hypothetical protein